MKIDNGTHSYLQKGVLQETRRERGEMGVAEKKVLLIIQVAHSLQNAKMLHICPFLFPPLPFLIELS